MGLFSVFLEIGGIGGSGGTSKNGAPTNFISDTYNQTFMFTKHVDFPLISDYEYSLDGGTTWTDNWFLTSSGRQIVPYGAYSIGQIKVRTKATTLQASDPISNDVAYTITGSNTGKVNLMNRGDSISTNIDSLGYSWQLETSLDSSKFILPMFHSALSGRRWRDFANGTNTTSDEILKEGPGAGKYYNEAVSRNLCIHMLGTNDCVYFSSDGVTLADIQEGARVECKRLRDQGWKLFLFIPPEPQHNDPADAPNHYTLAIYGQLREWLLTAWQTELGAMAVIDFYSYTYIGQWRVAWSSYWGDGIHWNGSGMTLAKGVIQPILEALEPNVSLIPASPSVSFDYTAKTMTLTPDAGYTKEDYLFTTDGMVTTNEVTSLTVSVTPGTIANKAGFFRRQIGKNARSLVTYNGSSF